MTNNTNINTSKGQKITTTISTNTKTTITTFKMTTTQNKGQQIMLTRAPQPKSQKNSPKKCQDQ
jgi:hypothetical protein